MLIKKLLPAALTATALLGAGQALAQEEEQQKAIVTGDAYKGITGNVTLTSDYRFRGISQSDEDPAIQGGFDYAWDIGVYIGTWGSVVDFGGGDFGSLELDYYIGWGMDITDNTSIDIGYIYYDYPGDSSCCEGDYQEVYGSISWRGLTGGVHYSDDYYAESGDFWYFYGDYSLGLFDDFLSVDFHVGYNDLKKNGGFLSSDEDSYIDYSIGLTVGWIGVDWSLAWVGTDLDEEDYFDTELAEDTVVFSMSRSL